MGIHDNATTLLQFLAAYEEKPDDPKRGLHEFGGEELTAETEMSAQELNDAVAFLEENDYVRVQRWHGPGPFTFGRVGLTPRGRFEAESLAEAATSSASAAPSVPGRHKYAAISHESDHLAYRAAGLRRGIQSPNCTVRAHW